MIRDRSTTRDARDGGTRRQRPRTLAVSSPLAGTDRERGQTTQDFAVGIGIFILAVAFVFSFLPSIVTPYDSSVGGAETAQADRIADRALEVLSTEDGPNVIDPGNIESDWENEDELAKTFGLRTADGGDILIDRMNASIQELNSEDNEPVDDLAFGPVYDDQAAASSARIVTIDESGYDEPAYRLVVRVW